MADRAIDVDALWRIAARKSQALRVPPQNLEVEGLRCLVASLQVDGRYDGEALRVIQREIFLWIVSYLELARDLERHPEITDVPVARPLFITGFGRTGSTLLLNLLALDVEARAPLLWQLLAPSPPPQSGDCADPRIAAAQRRVDVFTQVDPRVRQIHPMAPDAPDECHWMMRHSPLAVTLYRVPEYWTWLKTLPVGDLRSLYHGYRRQVQQLQLFDRRGHWLSKSFSHLHYMPVLHDVFPDANVVRLHRHPCQAIPSLCSLVSIYRRLTTRQVDANEIGATLLDMFVDGMDRLMNVPQPVAAQRAIDISYDELTADPVAGPIAVVRRIYDRFGYAYTPAFEQAMARRLEAQRAAERPRHVYTIEQFGLSRAQVLERTVDYLRWSEARCGTLAPVRRM
jgi:hypothetical protein